MSQTIERSTNRLQSQNLYQIDSHSGGWESYFSAEEYEEMTDVAERLRAPMDHTIRFDNRGGKLYCGSSVDGKDLLTISQESELAAAEATRYNPAWAVEALRRQTESQEIIAASALPPGAQMLVFSPIPDSVKSGALTLGENIGGYNLEKQTTMVRFWAHDNKGLTCRYISLDGGNRAALTAAAEAVGREMPAHYGSEEILGTFYTFARPEADQIAERAIQGYDDAMQAQTGRQHSYGQPNLHQEKALEIAAANPERLAEHMRKIQFLKWSHSGAELTKELNQARYNYAAALDQTMRGEIVVSNEDSGDAARAAGANFDGYCPGSLATSANSTAEAHNAMFGRREVTGKCPCCHEMTSYDPCNPVCKQCGSDSKTDRAAAYKAAKERAEKQQSSEEKSKRERDQQSDQIKRFEWGEGIFATIERAIGWGNKVLAVGQEAIELYRAKYHL